MIETWNQPAFAPADKGGGGDGFFINESGKRGKKGRGKGGKQGGKGPRRGERSGPLIGSNRPGKEGQRVRGNKGRNKGPDRQRSPKGERMRQAVTVTAAPDAGDQMKIAEQKRLRKALNDLIVRKKVITRTGSEEPGCTVKILSPEQINLISFEELDREIQKFSSETPGGSDSAKRINARSEVLMRVRNSYDVFGELESAVHIIKSVGGTEPSQLREVCRRITDILDPIIGEMLTRLRGTNPPNATEQEHLIELWMYLKMMGLYDNKTKNPHFAVNQLGSQLNRMLIALNTQHGQAADAAEAAQELTRFSDELASEEAKAAADQPHDMGRLANLRMRQQQLSARIHARPVEIPRSLVTFLRDFPVTTARASGQLNDAILLSEVIARSDKFPRVDYIVRHAADYTPPTAEEQARRDAERKERRRQRKAEEARQRDTAAEIEAQRALESAIQLAETWRDEAEKMAAMFSAQLPRIDALPAHISAEQRDNFRQLALRGRDAYRTLLAHFVESTSDANNRPIEWENRRLLSAHAIAAREGRQQFMQRYERMKQQLVAARDTLPKKAKA